MFTYGMLPLTYWRNWFSNIRIFFRNIKFAWQRATRGFCDQDAWNLNIFYTELFRDSLEYLAKNHYGHPFDMVYDEESGIDEWTIWLNETALLFDQSIDRKYEDFQYFPNKYEEEHSKSLEGMEFRKLPNGCSELVFPNEDKELSDKFFDEQTRIYHLRKACRDKGIDRLKERWDNLWD